MPIEQCPISREQCKYYGRNPHSKLRRTQEHGCFSDLDHIVPQRLAKTALTAAYIDLDVNKQMMCREEHEAKTKAGDEPLPEQHVMAEALMDAHKHKNPELHGNLLSQVRRILGEHALKARKIEAADDFLALPVADEYTGNTGEAA